MREITQINQMMINSPWLITQEGYHVIQSAVEKVDINLLDEEVSEGDDAIDVHEGIAVVPIQGTMMRGVSPIIAKFFGMTDTALIKDKIQMLGEADEVKGIMLDIDSPGGAVTGVEEAAQAVYEVSKKKPVYASVEGLMASAAYWVGSQANAVIASSSSKVGSIGVYLPIIDSSESYKSQGIHVELIKNKEATYKGAGFDGTSLTDDQKEYMQEMVQDIFTDFQQGVLRQRPQIKSDTMRGQVYMGKRAVGRGLADAVGSYEDAMTLLNLEINNS